jgi:hypothetical protein
MLNNFSNFISLLLGYRGVSLGKEILNAKEFWKLG